MTKLNWNRRRYTEEQFIEAWKNNKSYSDIARALNVYTGSGGQIYIIKRTGAVLGLDASHIDSFWYVRKENPNRTHRKYTPKRPLSEILLVNTSLNSHNLRIRLIKEGYKRHECEICHITEWMERPAPIVLDHVNGDHYDNRLENLRILCRNCDGQTETFGSKNRDYKATNKILTVVIRAPKKITSARSVTTPLAEAVEVCCAWIAHTKNPRK